VVKRVGAEDLIGKKEFSRLKEKGERHDS